MAVTAEGTRVWPQMRTMRPYSRITIVRQPTQRIVLIGVSPAATGAGSSAISVSAVDQAHEDFLKTVDLVAHRYDFDAGGGQLREQIVQRLFLGHLGLNFLVVHARQRKASDLRQRDKWRPQI